MRGKVRKFNIVRKTCDCPKCGEKAARHSRSVRRLVEVGVAGPVELHITYSKHYCARCRIYFSVDMAHIAPPAGRYTNRARRIAIHYVVRGHTLERARSLLWKRHFVRVPTTTMHDWVRDAEGTP